LQGFTTNSPLK